MIHSKRNQMNELTVSGQFACGILYKFGNSGKILLQFTVITIDLISDLNHNSFGQLE